MKFLKPIVILLFSGLFSIQSFGFFNPITDTTDRITVVYERVNGQWFEIGSGSGVDLAFLEWLEGLVDELDANTSSNCSSNFYISEPVSTEDAMLWNHDIAMSRPFPWGGVIGAGAGGAAGVGLALFCEAAFVGNAEGACLITVIGVSAAAGAFLGSMIDRYRERSNSRPPLTCGDRLMAIEKTCTDWIDSPQMGHREIKRTSVSFTSLPGQC